MSSAIDEERERESRAEKAAKWETRVWSLTLWSDASAVCVFIPVST